LKEQLQNQCQQEEIFLKLPFDYTAVTYVWQWTLA